MLKEAFEHYRSFYAAFNVQQRQESVKNTVHEKMNILYGTNETKKSELLSYLDEPLINDSSLDLGWWRNHGSEKEKRNREEIVNMPQKEISIQISIHIY
jgi:hypothetical protein